MGPARRRQPRITSPASWTAKARSARKWTCCGAIRARSPTWPSRLSSSTSTRLESLPGPRKTNRPRSRSARRLTNLNGWPGLAWSRIATPGRQCCTGIPRGEHTSTCWRRGSISRPPSFSTSPRQVGRNLTARCVTGSMKSMDGADRTTRSDSVSCSPRTEACLSPPSAIPGNRSRTIW